MKISEAKRQVMLQQWTELIQEQKASGMKVNAWCKERGIGEGQFYYWQKQGKRKCRRLHAERWYCTESE